MTLATVTAPQTGPIVTEARMPPARPRSGSPSRAHLGSGQVLWGGLFLGLCLLIGMGIAVVRQNFTALPLAGIFFLFPALAVGINLYRRRRLHELWQTGEAVSAEVTKAWRKTSGSGESRTSTWMVSYCFEVDGQPHTAQHPVIWKCELETIWAIYDPADPDRSLPHY